MNFEKLLVNVLSSYFYVSLSYGSSLNYVKHGIN